MAVELSRSEQRRATYLKWHNAPPGMSPEIADSFMAALKTGKTLRILTSGDKRYGPAMATPGRFKKHCQLNPEWGSEALRLAAENAKSADKLKGLNQFKTHCKHGHSLADARVYRCHGYAKRDCRTCWKIRSQLGGLIKPIAVERVKVALQNGASVSQVIHGKPVGGGKKNPSLRLVDPAAFYRYRRENPEFDRFVTAAMADSASIGQTVRYRRKRTLLQTQARRDQANDYQSIRAMLPAGFPDKDDVVSAIFEDLLNGSLKRENVRARLQTYIAAHNRLYPTKFAKFGDASLVSLDEVMFEDGSTTRGDTVSRGLWD